MANFTLFLDLGFRHILEGYDHLLFLLGLIIVTRDWRSLLSVISAFTVAHSATLVLSALEIISLPPFITESMIALSIAYVGIENIVRREQPKRWIVAGLFGLIHGAGFSGHLTGLLKTVLGMGDIWSPLVGFNLGIELGQLSVLAVTFPLLWMMRRSRKEPAIVNTVSGMIAVMGLLLVVARILNYEI